MLKFIRDENGITSIEYGMIGALISVGIIGALTAAGTEVETTFSNVHQGLLGEHRKQTQETAAEVYTGQTHGFGQYGNPANFAAYTAIVDHAARTGIDMPDSTSKMNEVMGNVLNYMKTDKNMDITHYHQNPADPRYNDLGDYLNYGDEPERNQDKFDGFRNVADEYLENCGADCFT